MRDKLWKKSARVTKNIDLKLYKKTKMMMMTENDEEVEVSKKKNTTSKKEIATRWKLLDEWIKKKMREKKNRTEISTVGKSTG